MFSQSPLSLSLVAILSLSLTAPAATTIIANYRLGESDPFAGPGSPAVTAVDSAGGNDLVFTGVPNGASYNSDAAISGSSLSVLFQSGGFSRNASIPTGIDNWGIEAWVKSNDPSVISGIVYNGDSAGSGMGLYQFGGGYIGLVGGKAFVGLAPITSNWTHLALVSQNGGTSFYVNGTVTDNGPAPNAPAGYLEIGARPDGQEQFNGRVDEVRLFTFTSGTFDPATDLQLTRVVPEPGSTALVMLGVAMAGFRRRR